MWYQGKAADCLGDQWKALTVDSEYGALAKGWTFEPGQVIITGAMGRHDTWKPGKYEGKWGPWHDLVDGELEDRFGNAFPREAFFSVKTRGFCAVGPGLKPAPTSLVVYPRLVR